MEPGVIQTLISTLGSIAVAIITVAIKGRIDQRQAKLSKEKEEVIEEKDLEEMVILQDWLDNLRVKYQFDRVSIFQFHNGGKFFQGKSMKKFSMSYESVAPGYEKIKRTQQNVLTTEYPHWISQMLKKKCFALLTEEMESKDRRDLESLGVKQFTTASIFCLKGHLIGFLVGYNIGEIDEDINNKFVPLVEDCKFVSGYLA
jgi:hypothetical protein